MNHFLNLFATPFKTSALISLVLLTAACYRSDLREWELKLPEARSPEELEALAGHLRDDNQKLAGENRAIEAVEARSSPPRLFIRYNSRMIARKNIAHLLADAGYSADGVPGNPEHREAFRRHIADRD